MDLLDCYDRMLSMHTVDGRQHAVSQPADTGSSRTPAGDAFSELVVRVFRVNGLLVAAGDDLAGREGQSTARWQVLAMVEDEPRSVAHIARFLGLARQSVQRL